MARADREKNTEETAPEPTGVLLKYTGMAHERTFSKADFSRHDIEDQGTVSFDATNNWVTEVSADAAEWLIENDGEFREATEDDPHEPDLSRVGSVASKIPLKRKKGAQSPTTHDPESLSGGKGDPAAGSATSADASGASGTTRAGGSTATAGAT